MSTETKPLYIFGGDSFTWGEGLELYIESDYWIGQRKLRNHWNELSNKQTDESKSFREQNRYPGLVASYFGGEPMVWPENGGGIDFGPVMINKNIHLNPLAVINQFTAINRMNFHFSRFCKCEMCTNQYGSIRPLMFYVDCLRKKLFNEEFTEQDLFYLDYLEKVENIPLISLTDDIQELLVDKVYTLFEPMFYRNLDIFIDEYLNNWIGKTKVLLIDSWDKKTSEYLNEHPIINQYLLPLKGWDGKYYKKWWEWESTFKHTRIYDEFPRTENGHPTLLQHQYIAESIIETLK
jgi:hypothetical protein